MGINGFGVFPVLYNNAVGIFRFIFLFGIILLYCDAPFFDRNQKFIFVRAGRTAWNLGQIFYVFLSAFFYLFFNVLVSILSCLPELGFSAKYWGEAFWKMANRQMETVVVSSRFLLKYTPGQAFFYGLIMVFLFTLFMGCLIYMLNLLCGKNAGVIAGSFLVCTGFVIDVLEDYGWKVTLSYVFPEFLTEIQNLDTEGIGGYPTFGYACVFFLVFIVMFILISLIGGRKANMGADSEGA